MAFFVLFIYLFFFLKRILSIFTGIKLALMETYTASSAVAGIISTRLFDGNTSLESSDGVNMEVGRLGRLIFPRLDLLART